MCIDAGIGVCTPCLSYPTFREIGAYYIKIDKLQLERLESTT